MLSLIGLAIRNFTVFLAGIGILMTSPVAGLRPIRAWRYAFTSSPMPGIRNFPLFDAGFDVKGTGASQSCSRRLLLSGLQVTISRKKTAPR